MESRLIFLHHETGVITQAGTEKGMPIALLDARPSQ